MKDDTPTGADAAESHPESTAPATNQPEIAASDAAAPRQPISPILLTIAFIIIVLLGVVIFQNLLPRGGGGSSESPAMASLRADIETRRAELNRERIALGLDPLPGTTGVETTAEVAERLKDDADTLASLGSSFQDLLERKELEIDQFRSESLTALKEQKRLRELLRQTNADLRAAMVDASLSGTLQDDLDKARATITTLNEELARLRDEPGALRAELIESNRRRNELEARVAELEEQLRRSTLFADSENELIKEAVALFRALRKLEGSTEQQLTAAYSRFGAELSAEVLDTCQFATGSAEVRPDLESRLRDLPAEAPANAMLFVVGYASETGDVENNENLSSDRATAVARILDTIKRPDQKVQAVYLGQTDRFSGEVPEENQRVEVWQIRSKASAASEATGAGESEDSATPPPLRPVPEFTE